MSRSLWSGRDVSIAPWRNLADGDKLCKSFVGNDARIVPDGPCPLFHPIILRKVTCAQCAPLRVAYHHDSHHIIQNLSPSTPHSDPSRYPIPLHIKMVPHPIRGHGTISFYPILCDVSSCSVLFVPAHQYAKHYRQHKIDHCHHHKAAKQTAHISNQQVFQGRRVNAQAR